MSKIEIFEAAGCCATSSVVVSDEAVKWNASAEWAKKNGVDIQRYSLAKNPQQFLNTPVAFYYGDPLGEMRLVSRVFEM